MRIPFFGVLCASLVASGAWANVSPSLGSSSGVPTDATDALRPLPENVIELNVGFGAGLGVQTSVIGEAQVAGVSGGLAYRNDIDDEWSLGVSAGGKTDVDVGMAGAARTDTLASLLVTGRLAPLGHARKVRPYLELGAGPYVHTSTRAGLFRNSVAVKGDLGLRPALGSDFYLGRHVVLATGLAWDWLPGQGAISDFRMGLGVAF